MLAEWDDPASSRVVRGTVTSVDIVGFTALSEALAQQGRAGSEELVGLVNDVFTDLIAITDRVGADILTFGGDAMTILCTGPDHTSRAAVAAAAMARVLDGVPRSTHSVPRVDLAMSTGLSAGDVHLFKLTAGHTDVVVAGATVTAALANESAASAGQVLLDHDTASALPTAWFDDGGSDGHRLSLRLDAVPDPTDPVVAASPADPVILGACIPRARRDIIAAGLSDGEHRLTTIGFLSLNGLDDRLAQGGHDAVAANLAELGSVLEEALAATGVHWLQSDTHARGAKLLFAAGAPTTTGEDERAMLRLGRAVMDAGVGIDLRMGVNRGRTFGGYVGSTTSRRSYSSMGDATNVAARLMGRAAPGEVMAAREVIDQSGPGTVAGPETAWTLKGKTEPVVAAPVLRIDRPADEGAADDAGNAVIGRDTEVAKLRLLVDGLDQSGAAITVIGPEGIGKTALVAAALADTAPVTRVHAERFDASRPFLVARLAIHRLVPRLDPHAPGQDADAAAQAVTDLLGDDADLAPLLGDLLDVPLGRTRAADAIDPAFRLARTTQLAARLVTAAITQPTVIVIENLQWLDDASRQVLDAIARGAGRAPLLVIATGRPEAGPLGEGEALELDGLDGAATTRLIRAAHPNLPDRTIAQIVGQAAGNPLFAIELGAVVGTGGPDLPDNLEALATARLDSLASADRLTLVDASVLGFDIDLDLLDQVRGSPVNPGWADRVSELVVPSGPHRWRFLHDVHRSAAYGALSYRRRRVLHRRVGEVLEQSAADPALLAVHFDKGDDHTKAWDYGVEAADAARTAHAVTDAIGLYGAALAHADHVEVTAATRASVTESYGDVLELAGEFEVARAAFDEARDLRLGDPSSIARLECKAGLVLVRQGDLAAATSRYAMGLVQADAITDPAVAAVRRAALLVRAAGLAYREGRYRDGERDALKAAHEAVDAADRKWLAHAFQMLDLCRKADGTSTDYEGWAAPMFEAAGDLVGQGNALNNEGIAAFYSGRWDDALTAYRRSARARERAGDVIGQAMSTNNIGEVLSDQGHLADAEAMFSSALRDWRAAGYAVGIAIATSNLGRLSVRRGDVVAGRALLEDAMSRFVEIEAAQFVVEAEGRLVEADLRAGAHGAALDRLARVSGRLHGALPAVRIWLQRLRGQVLLESNRKDDAITVLTGIDSGDAAYEAMWVAHLLGQVDARDALAERLGVLPEVFA